MTGFGAIAEFAIAEVPEDTMNTDKASSSPNLLRSGGKSFLHDGKLERGETSTYASPIPIVMLSGVSVQAQLADFLEQVRGNNELLPRDRDDLLTAVTNLNSKIDELLRVLQGIEGSELPPETARTWIADYKAQCGRVFDELLTSKKMANVTVPAGLSFGLTALGYAVGGPMAAGVGLGLSRVLLGDLKYGEVAEKVLRYMSAQSAVKSDAETNRPKGDEPDNS